MVIGAEVGAGTIGRGAEAMRSLSKLFDDFADYIAREFGPPEEPYSPMLDGDCDACCAQGTLRMAEKCYCAATHPPCSACTGPLVCSACGEEYPGCD